MKYTLKAYVCHGNLVGFSFNHWFHMLDWIVKSLWNIITNKFINYELGFRSKENKFHVYMSVVSQVNRYWIFFPTG